MWVVELLQVRVQWFTVGVKRHTITHVRHLVIEEWVTYIFLKLTVTHYFTILWMTNAILVTKT